MPTEISDNTDAGHDKSFWQQIFDAWVLVYSLTAREPFRPRG